MSTTTENVDTPPRRQGGGKWKHLLPFLAMIAVAVVRITHFHPLLEDHHRPLERHMMNPEEWKIKHHEEAKQKRKDAVDPKSKSPAKQRLSRPEETKVTTTTEAPKPAAVRKPPAPPPPPSLNTTTTTNPLLKLLQEAGLLQPDDLNHHLLHHTNSSTVVIQNLTLPTWPALQALYGPLQQPLILGQERCADYRRTVPLEKRYTGVAGMFNTGTNAMEFHLKSNVLIRHTWQIPWGKHRMPFVRLHHAANGLKQENQKEALPIVLIRDPFHWMQSMCGNGYAAHWKHTKKHCPNLVPSQEDIHKFGPFPNGTIPVKVIFDKDQIFYWDSLLDLYNDYYRQYLEVDYPRLMIRFEDMLLMPHAVLEAIATCADVELSPKLRFQIGSSKGHGSHTNFVHAIAKTGNAQRRTASMTNEDLEYARRSMDAGLLETFQYQVPDSLGVD